MNNILCLVGSQNKVKIDAATQAVTDFQGKNGFSIMQVISRGCDANPNITKWRSDLAEGQPFGAKQTAFGAINRMEDAWNKLQKETSGPQTFDRIYSIGFENGLVSSREVGKRTQRWADICFIAVKDHATDRAIVKRGDFVETEFDAPEETTQEQFDQAVKNYQNVILPKCKDGKDLYANWTAHRTDGLKTRGDFLSACLSSTLQELSTLEKAESVMHSCAEYGMAASAGNRYRYMQWTRDLAYMAPAYLQLGYKDQLLQALRVLKKTHSNGKMPIVLVEEENRCKFLQQRMRGDMQNPSWQIQLWKFCEEHCQEMLQSFPKPLIKADVHDIESLTLEDCTLEQLQDYYQNLKDFQIKLEEKKFLIDVPQPSYALKHFMQGTLENLTPGTRDSEIHFIRSLFTLVDAASQQEAKDLLEEFAEPLARVLSYLYLNNVDPKDGLPLGADSRDIFDQVLFDAKLLSNAVFLYQALSALSRHAETLGKTSFQREMKKIIQVQDGSKIPSWLSLGAFEQEKMRLKESIQKKLLFENEKFQPRDFIPGKNAAAIVQQPNEKQTMMTRIVRDSFPDFISGENIDPQGLAGAILAGLIPSEYHNKVVEQFKKADSPIGIQVFVPISGKTKEESLLMKRVKGRVVWPHISWAVVRSLISMQIPEALDFAEAQRDKLMKLERLDEWYVDDPETKALVGGGDPQQGWSASTMILAMKDLYCKYKKS